VDVEQIKICRRSIMHARRVDGTKPLTGAGIVRPSLSRQPPCPSAHHHRKFLMSSAPVAAPSNAPVTFADLGLAEPIVRAITEHGYTTPTPIQRQAIPAVLSGGDLLAGAQTGTGKTAGFTLPMLQHLLNRAAKKSDKPRVRALVLTPTRELAAQVEESVATYGKHTGLKSMAMFGGVSINPQIGALRRGVDILVATPGRLLDHHQQRTLDLSHVEILVLDEADRMLDMGFIHDIKKILAVLPKTRQNLLFSATFSDDIKRLADGLLHNPALIEVARRNSTAEVIAQKVHPVDRDKKTALLTHLIKQNDWHQVLVFTRTKHGANKLAEQLNKAEITALAIHGNKSQGARTRALAEFKSGELAVLVATDIAARGIDIDQLPHVVNYEIPNVPEDYVHRIGRTGRAGATGEAVSLVCVDEHKFFADIEKLIKRKVDVEVVPGFEPDLSIKPEPIQLRSPGHRPQGRRPQPAKPGQGKQGQAKQGQAKQGQTKQAQAKQGQAKQGQQKHSQNKTKNTNAPRGGQQQHSGKTKRNTGR
jgi:ATP-dependent RNA helicase RhlE